MQNTKMSPEKIMLISLSLTKNLKAKETTETKECGIWLEVRTGEEVKATRAGCERFGHVSIRQTCTKISAVDLTCSFRAF